MTKKSASAGRGGTAKPVTRSDRAGAAQGAEHHDPAHKFLRWIERNRRTIFVVGGVVIAATMGVWSVVAYQRNKEAQAQRELDQATFAVQTENLPLAASDLSRLVASRGGTRAADEALVLLAQVRLRQGEPTLAADELRRALDAGVIAEFRAPALALLAAALEEIGNLTEAAEAYLGAADACWYDFVAAQYLNDAGRVFWAAGDTARAAAAYERVLAEYEEAPATGEARVRLAEMRATAPRQEGPTN